MVILWQSSKNSKQPQNNPPIESPPPLVASAYLANILFSSCLILSFTTLNPTNPTKINKAPKEIKICDTPKNFGLVSWGPKYKLLFLSYSCRFSISLSSMQILKPSEIRMMPVMIRKMLILRCRAFENGQLFWEG